MHIEAASGDRSWRVFSHTLLTRTRATAADEGRRTKVHELIQRTMVASHPSASEPQYARFKRTRVDTFDDERIHIALR